MQSVICKVNMTLFALQAPFVDCEPGHTKSYKSCLPDEGLDSPCAAMQSDQSLLGALWLAKGHIGSSCRQQRLWSDYMAVQAELSESSLGTHMILIVLLYSDLNLFLNSETGKGCSRKKIMGVFDGTHHPWDWTAPFLKNWRFFSHFSLYLNPHNPQDPSWIKDSHKTAFLRKTFTYRIIFS